MTASLLAVPTAAAGTDTVSVRNDGAPAEAAADGEADAMALVDGDAASEPLRELDAVGDIATLAVAMADGD